MDFNKMNTAGLVVSSSVLNNIQDILLQMETIFKLPSDRTQLAFSLLPVPVPMEEFFIVTEEPATSKLEDRNVFVFIMKSEIERIIKSIIGLDIKYLLQEISKVEIKNPDGSSPIKTSINEVVKSGHIFEKYINYINTDDMVSFSEANYQYRDWLTRNLFPNISKDVILKHNREETILEGDYLVFSMQQFRLP